MVQSEQDWATSLKLSYMLTYWHLAGRVFTILTTYNGVATLGLYKHFNCLSTSSTAALKLMYKNNTGVENILTFSLAQSSDDVVWTPTTMND